MPRVYTDLIVDRSPHGEIILLHPVQPRWCVTNETGLDFLRHLDGTRTLEEVAGGLARLYEGVGEGRILADLVAFAIQLQQCNLLENMPLARKPVAPPKPRTPSMTIYVTEECNLRCKHCAIVEGRMPETTLSADDIRRLIDDHAAAWPNAVISFLGGEPLLRPDCLDLLEYAASKTTQAKIGTNGLLIDEAKCRRLANINAEFQVSLDGADPEVHDFIRGKGTFDRTWATIEALAAAGAAPRLIVASTLTRALLAQVQHLIERIDAVGPIKTLRFLNLNKVKAAETNWDRIAAEPAEMKRIYRWLLLDLPQTDRAGRTPIKAGFPGFVPELPPDSAPWCPYGETLIVDSQGKTYNCPVLNTPDNVIGDIRRDTLPSMMASAKNQELKREILGRRYVIEECRACAWRNFCQGGCAAYSSLQSGSMFVNDEFCDFRRDLYRDFVHRSNARS